MFSQIVANVSQCIEKILCSSNVQCEVNDRLIRNANQIHNEISTHICIMKTTNVLAKIWRNGNPHTPLMEMQNGAATYGKQYSSSSKN